MLNKLITQNKICLLKETTISLIKI